MGSALPGKPFRRRSGVPFRSAGQRPSPRASPLSTSRAPEGALRRSDAGRSRPAPPFPGSQSPSAHEGPRIRSSRACHARHLPPPAFRTPSAAYTPRPRPGLSHPGNAPGVSPSGPCSSPGGSGLSRGPHALLPFAPARRLAASRGDAVSRAFLSPESPCGERPKIARGRCPPGVLPSKALPSSAVEPDRPAAARPRGRTTTGPFSSSSRALSPDGQVAPPPDRRSGVFPDGSFGFSSARPILARSRGLGSPERRRRPFWGLPPLLARPAEAACECR